MEKSKKVTNNIFLNDIKMQNKSFELSMFETRIVFSWKAMFG